MIHTKTYQSDSGIGLLGSSSDLNDFLNPVKSLFNGVQSVEGPFYRVTARMVPDPEAPIRRWGADLTLSTLLLASGHKLRRTMDSSR